MMMALHFLAGVGVEHTGAKEGGTDQDVENIEHGRVSLVSSKAAAYGACCVAAKDSFGPV
jgi:hypothetical protein